MSAPDRQYEDLLARVTAEGTPKGDRTGTGTRSVFGAQLRYDLSKGFPLITTKRVHFKSVVGELLWFLSGSSNVSWLRDNGIRIWNEWADEDGELARCTAIQWRSWNAGDGRHIDQISEVLKTLKTNPDSRRMVVSAWNVGDLPEMALEPVTRSSSCTCRAGDCRCSSTSAARTCSWACPSTSRPTRCSLTCSPSRRAWRSANSFGAAGTATSTPTTPSR